MLLTQPSQDDASRFDFVEGVRSFTYRRLVGPLLAEYPDRVAEHVTVGGAAPVTKEDAAELYTRDPRYLFACGLQRAMQVTGWATAVRSVHDEGDAVAAELQRTRDTRSHSTLELDPDLALPSWYTENDEAGRDDIHLVPGGYWRDELVGAIYERGGSVYRLAWRAGYDARPGALEHFVRGAPPDAVDILDVGCAFGGLTRVLRAGRPEARVTGIDLSTAALTYAHHLAETGGQRITYAQRDATATGYEAETFDLVCGFLLLHEVPDDVRAAIVAEALRLLRPGGTLMFLDIPPYAALDPAQAWFESFDVRGNGEKYWEQFLASDFPGLLESTGFVDVADGPLDFPDAGYWGSSALWRTGEFDPVNRWVTTARKPEASR